MQLQLNFVVNRKESGSDLAAVYGLCIAASVLDWKPWKLWSGYVFHTCKVNGDIIIQYIPLIVYIVGAYPECVPKKNQGNVILLGFAQPV